MPNVVRGDRMAGLMTYLVGPGRANEHTEPHLMAGDPAMLAWHDDAELGRDGALAIARHLDRPRTAMGVEVPGGHVWHCSLSLRADEGALSDEQWRAIADDFVRAMDFDDAEGTKAPCRWVAVRHGVSTNGNDHIHIVVNLVREDGTKASVHNDFKRAQTAARVAADKKAIARGRAERAITSAELALAMAQQRLGAAVATPQGTGRRAITGTPAFQALQQAVAAAAAGVQEARSHMQAQRFDEALGTATPVATQIQAATRAFDDATGPTALTRPARRSR